MTKIDIGLLSITALVAVGVGVLAALGQPLSVLPEALLALIGAVVGKTAGPVTGALKARLSKGK